MALNALLDTALSVQIESLKDSRFEPLHYKVRKVLEEERFHFEHGRGWLARAGRERSSPRAAWRPRAAAQPG